MDILQEKIGAKPSGKRYDEQDIVDEISYYGGIRNGIFLGAVIAIYSLIV